VASFREHALEQARVCRIDVGLARIRHGLGLEIGALDETEVRLEGEPKTLRLVARYADGCNVFGDPAHAKHLMEVLASHCEEAGRDPAEITKTRLGIAVIAPTHEGAMAKLDFLRQAGIPEDRLAAVMAGDPDSIAEQASAFIDAGIEGLTVTIPDVHDLEAVELVGKTLGPLFAGQKV